MVSKVKAAPLLLCISLFIGCQSVDKAVPLEPVLVKCDECSGDGKVYYGPEHPIVKIGFDVGEYDCPMCGGTGSLVDE